MIGDWVLPAIDSKRCTGCGLCVARCPSHAVEMSGGYPAIVRPCDCSYCGDCEEACSEGAIGLGYEIVLPPDMTPKT